MFTAPPSPPTPSLFCSQPPLTALTISRHRRARPLSRAARVCACTSWCIYTGTRSCKRCHNFLLLFFLFKSCFPQISADSCKYRSLDMRIDPKADTFGVGRVDISVSIRTTVWPAPQLGVGGSDWCFLLLKRSLMQLSDNSLPTAFCPLFWTQLSEFGGGMGWNNRRHLSC